MLSKMRGMAYPEKSLAASDASVRPVPASTLLAALGQYPELQAQQQALSGMRFRIMLRHLALQGSNSSRRRVCLHLGDLVHSYGVPHGEGTAISIAFTQQEMGSICGLSRVSVSHIFSQLEREHVITHCDQAVQTRAERRLVVAVNNEACQPDGH